MIQILNYVLVSCRTKYVGTYSELTEMIGVCALPEDNSPLAVKVNSGSKTNLKYDFCGSSLCLSTQFKNIRTFELTTLDKVSKVEVIF